MADPTASVTFGVIAFQVGTEVWDEALQVDLARERLLSQRGAILSDVKPSPRIVTVKGMILGTAAAGPRADARADIDALAGAFLREEGDWLKLWTDRRCWARCVRCDLSQEQGTGYAIAFDGDFEIGDPTWESTDTTSFGGTMDGGLGHWDTRETRLVDYTGTAETGLFVRFIGRVSVGGIRAVNRFGNIVNNSTFGQVTASRYGGSATQAGVPDKWIADGYGETGLSFGSACRIWRGTTSIQTNPSFVYQDLPWVEDGDKISAQVHITLEHGSGTGYQGWFELEFYTKANALISTLTSPLADDLDGAADTIQLLNQTVPATT